MDQPLAIIEVCKPQLVVKLAKMGRIILLEETSPQANKATMIPMTFKRNCQAIVVMALPHDARGRMEIGRGPFQGHGSTWTTFACTNTFIILFFFVLTYTQPFSQHLLSLINDGRCPPHDSIFRSFHQDHLRQSAREDQWAIISIVQSGVHQVMDVSLDECGTKEGMDSLPTSGKALLES